MQFGKESFVTEFKFSEKESKEDKASSPITEL